MPNTAAAEEFDQHRLHAVGPTTREAAAARVLARVNELVPQLRSRAGETERLRRMHPDNLAELTEAGVFNLTIPADIGGSGGRRQPRHRSPRPNRSRLPVHRVGLRHHRGEQPDARVVQRSGGR